MNRTYGFPFFHNVQVALGWLRQAAPPYIMTRILQRELKYGEGCPERDTDVEDTTRIKFNSQLGVFLILGVGMGASLLIGGTGPLVIELATCAHAVAAPLMSQGRSFARAVVEMCTVQRKAAHARKSPEQEGAKADESMPNLLTDGEILRSLLHGHTQLLEKVCSERSHDAKPASRVHWHSHIMLLTATSCC
jgi:hypothetical protein